jgi:hypothetical protein
MDYECDSTLAELKKRFPTGAMVELVKMEDEDSPPMGTKGSVLHVDALGTVHVLWETGSTLGIIPSVDEIRLVSETLGDCNG